jgi:hypothetical protein
MGAVTGGQLAAVIVVPAHVAAVLNALHRGPLADAHAEDAVHEVLGNADLDVVTLTGDDEFVGDDVERCEVTLAARDVWRLADVAELLESRVLEAGGRVGETALTVKGAGVLDEARALLVDLSPALRWGAVMEVLVEDGGAVSYRELSVAVGSGLDGARRALAERVDQGSVLFARLMAGVVGFGSCPGRVELVSVSGLGGGRVVSLRLECGRVDRETEELIAECEGDVETQAELFASVEHVVTARRVPWPAVLVR